MSITYKTNTNKSSSSTSRTSSSKVTTYIKYEHAKKMSLRERDIMNKSYRRICADDLQKVLILER